MKRVIKTATCMLMAILLCVQLLGCTGSGTPQVTTKASTTGSTPVTGTTGATTAPGPEALTLPIVTKLITLTFFGEPEPFIIDIMKGPGDRELFKEMEKRTGIHVEFHVPPAGQKQETLNLMLATNQVDDMMLDIIGDVPGGAPRLLEDEIIIKLNDTISQYAPNLTKTFEQYPEVKKQSAIDDGSFVMFPQLRLDPVLRTNSGFQIRKDWLDKLSLPMPTTIDEWHTVLTAFKEKDPNGNGKNDEVPYVCRLKQDFTHFAPAWGVLNNFYREGSTVKYGPIEPAFKNFLTTMKQWYMEGLIDPEYASVDTKNFEAKVTGSRAGAFNAALSGGLGRFLTVLKDENPQFDLAGTKYPVGPAGKPYASVSTYINTVVNGVVLKAKDNKYIKESTKWLDYFYSEDGDILANWGTEGVSFTVKDGKRQFTDLILKNPDKLTVEQAASKYAGGTICDTPGMNNKEVFAAIKFAWPEQKQASDNWLSADTSLLLPPISLTPTESTNYSNTMSEVNTYLQEMINKFVMGQEPLDKFDDYVKTIKSMGIDDAIKAQQAAYDRYNKR